jgi:hypothetical protein
VVTGLEVVVGWLAVFAWGKAKRVAGRADAEVDQAIDTGMDRLHELVSAKLRGDPALARLEAEAGQDLDRVATSGRTRQRVHLALQDAVETDCGFAAALQSLVTQLREAGAVTQNIAPAAASNTGAAMASGGGVANTGVVMGDVNAGDQ